MAQVTGFTQFQFGDSLSKVQARLDKSFPDRTYSFDRGFGRTSIRLNDGMVLNGTPASTLFTFVDGKLADICLELDLDEAERKSMLAYLQKRFGASQKKTLTPLEIQLQRPTAITFAEGSVMVEDLSALDLLKVHFQSVPVMQATEAKIQQAVNLTSLRKTYEERGWLALPHQSIQSTDPYLKALINGDTLERFALAATARTREQAWIASYFYAMGLMDAVDEKQGWSAMTISGDQLRNPLAAFLVGRINFYNAETTTSGNDEAAQAKAKESYIQMLNAYTLTSNFSEDYPQLAGVLANSHAAMLSGLANGLSDVDEETRTLVEKSWEAYWAEFKKLYQVE